MWEKDLHFLLFLKQNFLKKSLTAGLGIIKRCSGLGATMLQIARWHYKWLTSSLQASGQPSVVKFLILC